MTPLPPLSLPAIPVVPADVGPLRTPGGAMDAGQGATRRELPTGEALLVADVEPQARGLSVQAHAQRVLVALGAGAT